MHALEEYGSMYVKLYEDITNFGYIATAYDYPVMVNQRYLMKPSPIPRFDNPKMNNNPALQLFVREEKKNLCRSTLYRSEKLDFEDYPFTVEKWGNKACNFLWCHG